MDIIKYTDLYKKKLFTFIDKNYSNNHPILNNTLFDWQYKNREIYLAINKNRIVGFNNFIKVKYQYIKDGKIVIENGINYAMSKILKQYNGFQLIHKPHNDYNIITGMGFNTKTILPILKELNYIIIEKVPRYFINIANYESKFCKKKNSLITKIDSYELEKLWINSTKNVNLLSIHRDREFWEWRYINSPKFINNEGYNFFGNYENGIIVFRYENYIDKKVIRILELIPKNNKIWEGSNDIDFDSLIIDFLNFSKNNNVYLIDFYCTHKKLNKYIERLGFKECDNSIPNNFKNPKNYYPDLNYVFNNDKININKENIYETKSCGDMDRPDGVNKIENKKNITIGILSNVNIDPIKNILESKLTNKDNVNIITIEYGQLLQNLNFNDSVINKNDCNYIFIIDRPEDILRKSLDELTDKDNEIIEYYFSSIEKFINNNKNTQVYIMNYFLSNKSINFNCFDNKVIYDFNKKIYYLADNYPNCYILKNLTAENITDKRMWYIGKIPYTDIFFENLSKKIFGIILSHLGLTTRLLILDLDNTLWGGVVGEDGVHGIKLGEDYPGNVFVDFQKKIKLLKERGIVLAICSKNDLSIVNEVFEKNKNMILKKEDFVYIEANWQPKVDNIRKISEKIGLGLKNILFVDDNPVERDQVKQFLPDVKVLDLPDDPIEYIDCLLSSPYLEVHKLTESDKNRSNTYQKKVIVDKLKEYYEDNKEEFYRHLELEIFINNLTNENKDRCIQLLSKTNQFNTTTLRLTENDILNNNYKVYVLGAKDKYNDYENMGVMVTKELDNTLEIIDYLLSCRFLGKNLENEFIKWILNYSENKKFKKVIGKITETDRNEPVRNIFKNNNFIIDENNIWEFNINEKVKYTDYIKINENLNTLIIMNKINEKIFEKKDISLNKEYFNISIKLKNILKDLIDDECKDIFENLIETNKLYNDINLIPSWTSLKHIIFINKFEKCLGKKLTSNEIGNFKLISDFDNLI